MHCTQSRISKLEASTDGDLSIDELRSYAAAVGLELSVAFIDQQPKSRGSVSDRQKLKHRGTKLQSASRK
jgi:hypothetical protein